jgi:hypothetical protein
MVHPKYSPEEALKRAKLMMGYDTKKTLTENIDKIGVNLSEQGRIMKDILAGASVGAGTGALLGGVTAIPGAVVGAIYGLIVGMTADTPREDQFKALVAACSTNKKDLGKKTMDDNTLDGLSDKLNKAFNYHAWGFLYGTDEPAVKEVFSSISTIPDFCGLVDNYSESYGDLYKDLAGEMDGDDEWRDYVLLPLRPAIRASKKASENTGGGGAVSERQQNINNMWCSSVANGVINSPSSVYNGKPWTEYMKDNPDITVAELDAAKASCSKKTGGGGGGGGMSYKPCSGTYQYGCKSDVIAKVQGCLKISADGKFGPKTKAALSKTGFTTFTDADVDKICSGTEEKLGSDVESQTLGQDQNVSNTNTDVTSNTNQPDSTTKTGIS